MSLILGCSNLIAGFVCLALSWPLYRGKVARNHWYGFRTRKSLASDDIWYATNKYGAKAMLPWAAAIAGLGAGTLLVPLKPHPGWAILVALAPIAVVIPAIQTAFYCRRLAGSTEKAAAAKKRRRRNRKKGN